MTAAPTRRDFLDHSVRAGIVVWAALELPWLGALAGCTGDRQTRALVRLTFAEGRALRAFAARIIPADDGEPGADTLGAVEFTDRALGTPAFAELVPVMRAGLADLDERGRALHARDFASLPEEQQVTVMREIESGPFFAAARTLVIVGTFADPSYGGNRGMAGWTMIGMDHRPSYTSPFGWYDAKAAQRGKRVV